jgi:hypothetical protein
MEAGDRHPLPLKILRKSKTSAVENNTVVVCDPRSSVVWTTVLADRVRGVAPKGYVRFSDQIISVHSAFAPALALTFESLDYVADHSGDPHSSLVWTTILADGVGGITPKGYVRFSDQIIFVWSAFALPRLLPLRA